MHNIKKNEPKLKYNMIIFFPFQFDSFLTSGSYDSR